MLQAVKVALKEMVKLSTKTSFKGLCHEADANLWGVAMVKIRGSVAPVETCPGKVKMNADELFPPYDPTAVIIRPCRQGGSEHLQRQLAKKMKVKKAPVREVSPTAIEANPDVFRTFL